jgi:hypothetical protein
MEELVAAGAERAQAVRIAAVQKVRVLVMELRARPKAITARQVPVCLGGPEDQPVRKAAVMEELVAEGQHLHQRLHFRVHAITAPAVHALQLRLLAVARVMV